MVIRKWQPCQPKEERKSNDFALSLLITTIDKDINMSNIQSLILGLLKHFGPLVQAQLPKAEAELLDLAIKLLTELEDKVKAQIAPGV